MAEPKEGAGHGKGRNRAQPSSQKLLKHTAEGQLLSETSQGREEEQLQWRPVFEQGVDCGEDVGSKPVQGGPGGAEGGIHQPQQGQGGEHSDEKMGEAPMQIAEGRAGEETICEQGGQADPAFERQTDEEESPAHGEDYISPFDLGRTVRR